MYSDGPHRSSRRRADPNATTPPYASSTTRDRDAVPRTPPSRKPPVSSSKGRSSRALKTSSSRPPTRDGVDIESFLDSIGAVDTSNKENDRPDPVSSSSSSHHHHQQYPPYQHQPHNANRDSHDLSLPARQVTRDSLVANMLLSLDQLSLGQMQFGGGAGGGGSVAGRSPYDDGPTYSSSSFAIDDIPRSATFTSRSYRPSPGHGYSYSSDLDAADDASRISSSQPSRGRRSNSSSGFPSHLGRINSLRESASSRPPPSNPGTPRPAHARGGPGGRGSKSSSTNSIDAASAAGYAQVLGSQRWAHGIGRSASFDRGSSSTQQAPWHIEFSNSFLSDEYDAAPTPTVPGGPRKLATVPSLPVLLPPPPLESPRSPGGGKGGGGGGGGGGPERKRSTRSSRSATLGRKPDLRAPVAARDIPPPPVPLFDLDSAPAPHVGYEKAKDPPPGLPTVAPAREKQGFFRRMFGSSKSSSLPASASQPVVVPSGSVDTSANRSQPTLASQTKTPSAPPSRDSQHHSTTHMLQKKTSSFFRRRKYSASENEPPPVPPPPPPPVLIPPVHLPAALPAADALSAKPEPSPITSLRRAMDPYLKGSPTSPHLAVPSTVSSPLTQMPPTASAPTDEPRPPQDERDRNARGFSPDYEPSPKAVIRQVDADPSDHRSGAGRPDSPTPQRPPEPHMARSGSFFHDNSDDESSPRQRSRDAAAAVAAAAARGADLDDRSLRPTRTAEPQRRTPSPAGAKSGAGARDSPTDSRFRPGERVSTFGLPIEGATTTTTTTQASSTTSLPRHGGDRDPEANELPPGKPIDEPEFVVGDPTEDDRQKAQKIFDGNEDFIQKEKAAAWMGEEGPVRQRTLRAYMDLYDFTNLSILASLRLVCARLVLRAETQQVDRILVAFASRWCACNPNHGFKSTDIIHTICYSIMLLNTDLHMADIEHKMTRSQFVKNTMTTIKQTLEESAPEAFERPSILPGRGRNLGVAPDSDPSVRPSSEQGPSDSLAPSTRQPPRPESSLGAAPTSTTAAADGEAVPPLVQAPFDGPLRLWEGQVETVLKDIYASIRDERLPLFGAELSQPPTPGGLSVMGMLRRTPSVLSKAASEGGGGGGGGGGGPSSRGRLADNSARAASSSRFSKSRSRHRALGGGFSSSRTSFDDGNSIWSPTESSATWSRYSLGRTHTSASMDSFGSAGAHHRGDYQQSIGFANALSQAIIREDHLNHNHAALDDCKQQQQQPAQLLEDESLELAGPPWVKEGMVTHKHHLDGVDKKAKDRNWTEVFAVVQKGQLALFSFSPVKTLRKSRSRLHGVGGGGGSASGTGSPAQGSKGTVVVGGGNWQENATNLATFSLRQALASALPPPGYSRQRPHVWALSLPTGAVHLFQVGTPEIIKEFVNTSNYWSARLSTHPLVGGISNVEYGWSDAIVHNALVTAIHEGAAAHPNSHPNRPDTSRSSTKGHSRPGSSANANSVSMAFRTSLQSHRSMRSGSFDFARPGTSSSSATGGGGGGGGAGSSSRHGGGGKLPGDRAAITEWTPPTQSLRASTLPEAEQLQALLRYVRSVEEELQAHNALRGPMLLAFTPRGSNHARAMANWQRKSEYLLREIVKFRTYVDALRAAEARRAEVYRERETTRRAAMGEDVESDEEREEGDEEDEEQEGGVGSKGGAAEPADGGDETLKPE